MNLESNQIMRDLDLKQAAKKVSEELNREEIDTLRSIVPRVLEIRGSQVPDNYEALPTLMKAVQEAFSELVRMVDDAREGGKKSKAPKEKDLRKIAWCLDQRDGIALAPPKAQWHAIVMAVAILAVHGSLDIVFVAKINGTGSDGIDTCRHLPPAVCRFATGASQRVLQDPAMNPENCDYSEVARQKIERDDKTGLWNIIRAGSVNPVVE